MQLQKWAIALLLSGFAFSSCKMIKTVKIMNKGSVAKEEFSVSVPFEYRMGLMIIDVTVNGKKCKFLVDTGAPNLVSKELAAELQLETKVTQEAGDSQGGKGNLDFVVLDSVSIGGLEFLNTGAAVADLKQSKEIACLGIDGFIGANLMKQAIWEIDYDKQVFTIVSSREKLAIPNEGVILLPFKPATSGTPKVTLHYNNTEVGNVTFDTGANGDFSSNNDRLKALKKDTIPVKTRIGFGRNASGLYGNNSSDTITFAQTDIGIGNATFPDQVVRFQATQATLMGNEFLKNFRVIIDWGEREILLLQNKQPITDKKDGFGLAPVRSNDRLTVGFVVLGSDAGQQGIQVGDTIAKINDTEYLPLMDENWCDLLYQKLGGENAETVAIEIIRNGERKRYTLRKQALFE